MKPGDPLYEVWCECCWMKVRDYRIIDAVFKCECCISKEEAHKFQGTAEMSDEEWEMPASAWRVPGGGENAA